MNKIECKETQKLVIKAIEEYLNNHELELMRKTISPMTNAYYLMDRYKDELIKEAYKKEE